MANSENCQMFCSIISSIDENFVMGVDNTLAYKSSKDLKSFSKFTRQADMIVMGRKTWESLPIQPLPGRKNVIISTTLKNSDNLIQIYPNLEELFNNETGNICFIGGAKIFDLLYRNYPHYIDIIRITKFESFIIPELNNNLVYFPSKILENFIIINKDSYQDNVKVTYLDKDVVMKIEYTEYMSTNKNRVDSIPSEVAYLNLMRNLLLCPLRTTRNGNVRSLFSNRLKYDCRDGKIPLLTTKKVAWKAIIKELLWFIKGDTNNNHLIQEGVHIWDGNSSRQFLDNRGLNHYKDGDCGPIYGFQWRHFGAQYKGFDETYTGTGVDQLEQATQDLLTDPYSRRIIISAWNVSDLDKMCLPPCHVMMQFYVDLDGLLSLQFYQRSMDCFLGAPFNMASYSVLLHMMAQRVNKKPGFVYHIVGDYHIYENHEKAVREQLCNPVLEPPTLSIKNCYHNWNDYKIDDFEVIGYISAGKISAPMSA